MSVFTDAQVTILLADYAVTDAAGKLNVIGGGISFIGALGGGQPSSPFTAVVSVSVPAAKYIGQSYALTVELHDVTTGTILQVPSGPGTFEAIRAQQVVTVPPTQPPPGYAAPQDALSQHVITLAFGNGLPLEPGHSYEWRVQIDGQRMKNWWNRFHVLGPAPGVVFGGPNGPSNIPGVGTYSADLPAEEAGAPRPPSDPEGEDSTS